MKAKTREDQQGQQPMGRGRAFLFKFLGPAESWDNPVMRSRFGPAVKQGREQARRAERQARRLARSQRHQPHEDETEHFTPDE